MPIRPHQASNDEGFGIRVTRVSLHRVADGPLSTHKRRSFRQIDSPEADIGLGTG
jgi:hypothetical protein